MKILFLGTVCDLKGYEALIAHCKTKTTVATVVFETALLQGLRENGAEVDILSYPMIPAFPNSKYLYWGNKKEKLDMGYTATWLKTVNVPYLKQWSRCADARRKLRKWIRENQNEERVVLTYNVAPFLASMLLRECRRTNTKCCPIIPDLPRDMYVSYQQDTLQQRLKNRYLRQALQVQGEFDGYVYLTEAMKDVINPDKPYIVMEGVAEDSGVQAPKLEEKAQPRAVMYAGRLHGQYGLLNLLDAFEAANPENAELWLFGDGNAVETIEKRAEKNPSIRYFGRKTRDEILEFERKATLLVNVRSVDEEFVKYSFPSKTIEYMLSGTPLLTTELPGIPKEYFDHVFHVENNTVECLAKGIRNALSNTQEQLWEFGSEARNFIKNEKNGKVQSGRILRFLEELNRL